MIKQGDLVILKYDEIVSLPTYQTKTFSYKHFVESNKNKVFVAEITNENKDMIGLKNYPQFVFHKDLISHFTMDMMTWNELVETQDFKDLISMITDMERGKNNDKS